MTDTPEDGLLLASRQGDLKCVVDLLSNGEVDINCKGKHKSNLGWSPLHLAAYFGHNQVVETLLEYGGDVNVINGMGDTALHRAAFTARTDVVLSLLHYNADVSIINGEGRTPLQMSDSHEVKKLIAAAEKSQQLSRNESLLQATTEGNINRVKELLGSTSPPNINCQNLLGNTALHCAAYRGHKEIAVMLLQNGINSTIKNNRGLSALELSRDSKMRQLLDVHPLQAVQKTVQRFEGYVMKKSRFFGWQKHWVVLERGILSAFHTRADASSGLKRQFFKYLDSVKISAHQESDTKFKAQYSDHSTHFFMTVESGPVNRQRWLNSLKEHCAYSTHYTSQPHIVLMDELDEDYLPLGCMEDALNNAKAQQQVLDHQVSSLNVYFNTLADQQIRPNQLTKGSAATLKLKLSDVVSSSREVCSTLNHCLAVLVQQEEVRRLQLQEEAEKRRVLEDALHVLATEHFVLEQSLKGKRSLSDTNDTLDEFYDATETMSTASNEDGFDGGPYYNKADSSEHDSVSDDDQIELHTVNGGQSRDNNGADGADCNGQTNKYRKRLPHSMHSRNEFSIWSVLKQAVGKDLSRMAMPVIFNEPLSFLQRISEYMDYVPLLHEAAATQDPVERLLRVATFMISCNASTEDRIGKPFNPLLGETYELVREDQDFALVAEQVSHHPPISALYMESKSGFQLTMSMQPDLKFWGKSIEVKPKGNVIIKFPGTGDIFTFSYVSSGVHNVIIGNLWIELYGVCEVKNHRTGDRAIVNFKPAGWFGKDMNQVEGYIVDKKDQKKKLFKGDWTQYVCSCAPGDPQLLSTFNEWRTARKPDDFTPPPGVTLNWRVTPKPSYSSEMYMMTEFAMGLNHLLPDHQNVLPRTDSRYRPDLRCLENGDIEQAASEKLRLEEEQRHRRKLMNTSGEVWTPNWFSLEANEQLNCKEWKFNNTYFQRNFQNCPNIYE